MPEKLCHALAQNQITEPTAVQNGAIPVVLAGRDLISSARTGSGKTLAYALPVMSMLQQGETALVLVPTREIGVQVQQVMQPYLKALGLPPAALIIGGVSFGPQIASLKRRPPVIIATPGRLNDHFANSNGKFRLDHLKFLVLDEADRMLDMGFLPQVKQILQYVPEERQTLLFSATMPSDLARACREMLRDPERVAVDAPNTANVDIDQRMQEVTVAGKQNALLEALNAAAESALVFTRTKRRTDRVAQQLEDFGVRAERIHGDRSQAQRQKAIDLFRGGKVKVLVATDIAARGLDIPLVELVVNYDLPEAKEDYVHRIGRTGRAGAQGVALSFVLPEERGHWASISGQKRGSQQSNPRAPLSRKKREEQRAEEPAMAMASSEPAEAEQSEQPRSWSKPQPKSWGDRPKRREFSEQRPQQRSFERPQRREWSDQRPQRSENSGRPSRFKRWGEKRAEGGAPAGARAWGDDSRPRQSFQQRDDRGGYQPRESRGGQRSWGQPREERGESREFQPRESRGGGFRPWANKKPNHIFTGREGDDQRPQRKSRFGGHGHSAPPAEGKPRGRWAKRPNRDQPRD